MLLADEKRLALLAVCVRSGVVLLTTALDIALPDYDTSKFITPEISKYLKLTKVSCLSAWPCGVGMRDMAARGMCDPLHSSRTAGQLPRTPSAPLQGWLVWDSVFFADIAARGYAFEQYYAFFPLLPGLVSLVAPTRLFAVVALAINAAASVLATGPPGPGGGGCGSVLRTAVQWGYQRRLPGALLLPEGSRGLALKQAYSTFCLRNTSTSTSTSPPTGDMDRMRQLHREWTIDNRWPRPWCSAQVPYVYGFVQSEYWNVGFLRYWTWQQPPQLPNFLLAAPVVLLSVSGLAVYCTANCRHVMLRLGLTPLEPAEPPPRGAHPGYDDDDGDDGDDGEAAAAAEEEDDISDGKGGDEEVGVDGAAAACGPLSAAGFEPQKGKAAEAEPGGQPRFQAPGPDSSTGLRQRRRQRQEDSAGCSQDDAAADDGAAVSSALDDGPRTHGSHDWSPAAVRAEGPLVASLLAAPSGLGRREGAVKEVIAQALAGIDASRVVGISVSGQQHGLVVLGDDGEVLRPAKLWCDTESAAEAKELSERLGWTLVPSFTITKLLWLKRHEPAVFEAVRCVLLPHDYINYWMTGRRVMECGDASGTGVLDVAARRWDEEAMEVVDPRVRNMFPPLVASPEEAIGGLLPEVASELGLAPGVVVAPGSGDNAMSALGAGAAGDGATVMSLGTSGTIFSKSPRPLLDRTGVICSFCDTTGSYLPLLCTLNCTRVLEEVCGAFGMDHATLTDLAGKEPPGCCGVTWLPYMIGERTPCWPHSSGALLGLRPGCLRPGLVYRAAVEGATLSLLSGFRRMVAAGLRPSRRLRLVGGGARNPLWRQMVADVFQMEVLLPSEPDSAALGAALQAAAVVTGESVASYVSKYPPPLHNESL
ncbi:hypothetical protein VOLCADRAFT_91860 [Volvox carteri f. nagariensis]|uniref:glycerol kinase n=1 Tax=Volvox carteri f. nagariensis TaxID=3068 RepID=D8TY54_VOLCA|nr:uncharacterized protein VOLCADRAFT_91860 [Volvox carteri f. nagariensis]EFJ47490.1 hypothetical protein VOLCADRAFT_91860 [Volvox carteri f. nagariensis]|eukprot:XP_002951314.1 hypothetical protein VOLCADRAFT_91860 [Volvox carteri f. nagariensis]